MPDKDAKSSVTETGPQSAPDATTGKKRRKAKKRKKARKQASSGRGQEVAFPKDSLLKCLRIPQGVIEQNAGNECTDREAAAYAKIGWTGPISVEISSAIKYDLLSRPSPGTVNPTDLARKITRPQQPKDRLDGLREAVLQAPVIGDFYKRYRGENLPDREFLLNTAADSFHVPKEKADEFVDVFLQALKDAELLEEVDGSKARVLDVTTPSEVGSGVGEEQIRKLSKGLPRPRLTRGCPF